MTPLSGCRGGGWLGHIFVIFHTSPHQEAAEILTSLSKMTSLIINSVLNQITRGFFFFVRERLALFECGRASFARRCVHGSSFCCRV